MKNSLQLGKVGGVTITIHWTFLLLIVWIIFLNWKVDNNTLDTFWSLLFVFMIFGSVILHELGHAYAASRFGIKTRSITLLPIGGLARLDSLPEKPKEELIVAIAGPVVNILIALIIYPFLASADPFAEEGLMKINQTNLLPNFFSVNIILASFNLLPAFPMDGGRVLRALLSFRFARHVATRIAAYIGQLISIIFILVGFFYNPFLVFIGLFIFIGAQAEASYTKTQFMMKGFTAHDAMATHFATLDSHATINDAVKKLLEGQATHFLVTDHGVPTGSLERNKIIQTLSQTGSAIQVSEVMDKDLLRFEYTAPLLEVWTRMQQKKQALAAIFSRNQLVGIVDNENILEFILVREASERPHNS